MDSAASVHHGAHRVSTLIGPQVQEESVADTAVRAIDELALRTAHEQGYAELAVALLRESGHSDEEILRDFTQPVARVDAMMEQQYQVETGLLLSAANVKARMRRLVMQ